ncbi:hypothetical protein NDU88_000407 [Pleurodeles waltl]|uniref:Uncharacterized protein n=1 Tax=Pleurodeles waltl TaxID=8319 RepID=A0AAV7UR82_PLEWA|nr:hypothetical protein NDU88_000407 [Pleurodeles waltl]
MKAPCGRALGGGLGARAARPPECHRWPPRPNCSDAPPTIPPRAGLPSATRAARLLHLPAAATVAAPGAGPSVPGRGLPPGGVSRAPPSLCFWALQLIRARRGTPLKGLGAAASPSNARHCSPRSPKERDSAPEKPASLPTSLTHETSEGNAPRKDENSTEKAATK